MPHRGIETASAACRSDALPTELYYPISPFSDPVSDTVVRQTDFDVIIGQCVVSDRNLAWAILIKHKELSAGKVKVCLLA